MKKIFRLFMVAAVIILGAFWFIHWSNTRALSNSDARATQQPDHKTKAEPSAPVPANQPDASTQPTKPQEAASNTGRPGGSISALPASETITRNSPNGIAVAGSGKFQLYRQGDMTFRMNTETGQACVLFATDAQWRKPLVYDHGCAAH